VAAFSRNHRQHWPECANAFDGIHVPQVPEAFSDNSDANLTGYRRNQHFMAQDAFAPLGCECKENPRLRDADEAAIARKSITTPRLRTNRTLWTICGQPDDQLIAAKPRAQPNSAHSRRFRSDQGPRSAGS